MSDNATVRAWKDLDRRNDMPPADHPAGEIALDPIGGNDAGAPVGTFTILCCTVDAVWCPPQSPLCMPETV